MPIDEFEEIILPVTGQIRTPAGWFNYNSLQLREHFMNDDMFVAELLWNNDPTSMISIYIDKVDLIEFCWKVFQTTDEGTPIS